MEYTLKNEQLTVTIDDLGAQLTSIRAADGTELLWGADPAVWGRHAPLLFPVIGRLKDQKYLLDGEEIAISQHGFARDLVFSVSQDSAAHIAFTLCDSGETRKVYPFSFRLTVEYTLTGGSLRKTHTVENRSDREMPYELGGHDGYNTTLRAGEKMSDYYIEFPGQTELHPFHMDESCFLTDEKYTYPLENGHLPMPPRVFGLDTVVLEDLPVRRVTLANTKNPIRLTVDFADFDYLGIWTKLSDTDTNYVCIEPWTTLPECTFVGAELKSKRGIRILPAGGSESLSYTLTVEV